MSKHSALNNFGRSGNPAFQKHFNDNQNVVGEVMTLDGTVNKTGILLALCFGGAYFGWNAQVLICLLYTSPSPRDKRQSRMPSSA